MPDPFRSSPWRMNASFFCVPAIPLEVRWLRLSCESMPEEHLEVYSAGLQPSEVNPYTERVMREIGIDLSGQHSKSVKEYLGKMSFSYLITVCAEAEANCPTTFPGIGQRLSWAFDDPAAVEGSEEEKLQKFREVRDQVAKRIRLWLAEKGILQE